MMPQPNLNVLAKEFHDLSVEKGWVALDRTDAVYMNLMVTELSEAVEEYRNGKKADEIYYEVKVPGGTYGTTTVHIVAADRLDEYRRNNDVKDPKPCGIPIELADGIIRIMQFCSTKGIDLEDAVDGTEDPLIRTDLNEAIADTSAALSCAWIESPSYDKEEEVTSYQVTGSHLAAALLSIMYFCTEANIDIWHWVKVKHEYNKSRPQLHGGKKA